VDYHVYSFDAALVEWETVFLLLLQLDWKDKEQQSCEDEEHTHKKLKRTVSLLEESSESLQVWSLIFGYLQDARDVVSSQMSCKLFKRAAIEDQLWQNLLVQDEKWTPIMGPIKDSLRNRSQFTNEQLYKTSWRIQEKFTTKFDTRKGRRTWDTILKVKKEENSKYTYKYRNIHSFDDLPIFKELNDLLKSKNIRVELYNPGEEYTSEICAIIFCQDTVHTHLHFPGPYEIDRTYTDYKEIDKFPKKEKNKIFNWLNGWGVEENDVKWVYLRTTQDILLKDGK